MEILSAAPVSVEIGKINHLTRSKKSKKSLKGACDEKMTCDFSPDSDSPSNSEPKMFLQHVKIR